MGGFFLTHTVVKL